MLKFGGTQGLLSQREYDELMHRGMELLTLFREEQEVQSHWSVQVPGCGMVLWQSDRPGFKSQLCLSLLAGLGQVT